jgi:hypothetical protein
MPACVRVTVFPNAQLPFERGQGAEESEKQITSLLPWCVDLRLRAKIRSIRIGVS